MVHQVKQLAISLLARESDRGGTDATLGKVHIVLHDECRCTRTSPIVDFFRLVWKCVIKTSRPTDLPHSLYLIFLGSSIMLTC